MWFKNHSELAEDIRSSIKAMQPELTVRETDDDFYIEGKYVVSVDGKVVDYFDVRIIFPFDYPNELPKIFETSNRIPKIPARHFNQTDTSACLFVPYERWRIWPLGKSFKVLLSGAINDFFVGQIYFDEYDKWPHGERAHGNQGILKYFSEIFNTCDKNKIISFLEEISKNKSILFLTNCPCGSNKRLSHCHLQLVEAMRKGMPQSSFKEAIQTVKSYPGKICD